MSKNLQYNFLLSSIILQPHTLYKHAVFSAAILLYEYFPTIFPLTLSEMETKIISHSELIALVPVI